ncbi:UNVERIFIED_CONTAM: hypothetical protein H355_003353 [Colinus virginianus]|nr:hypothetical protein H355_003353 [Colinus virginianus]
MRNGQRMWRVNNRISGRSKELHRGREHEMKTAMERGTQPRIRTVTIALPAQTNGLQVRYVDIRGCSVSLSAEQNGEREETHAVARDSMAPEERNLNNRNQNKHFYPSLPQLHSEEEEINNLGSQIIKLTKQAVAELEGKRTENSSEEQKTVVREELNGSSQGEFPLPSPDPSDPTDPSASENEQTAETEALKGDDESSESDCEMTREGGNQSGSAVDAVRSEDPGRHGGLSATAAHTGTGFEELPESENKEPSDPAENCEYLDHSLA